MPRNNNIIALFVFLYDYHRTFSKRILSTICELCNHFAIHLSHYSTRAIDTEAIAYCLKDHECIEELFIG